MEQKKRYGYGLGLIALVMIGLAACSRPGGGGEGVKGQGAATAEATAIAVEVATVQRGNLEQAIEVTGELKAFQDTTLSPKVSGRIERIYVREGDPVTAGQVVAVQDTSDLRVNVQQAAAAVKSAEARLQQAIVAAQVQPEQTDAQIKTAEAGLNAAKARLKALQAGARPQEREQAQRLVDQAKAQLDWAKIDYDNTKRLYEQGAVPKAQLDAKKSGYDAANAQYQQALQSLSLVQEGPRREDIETAEQQVRQAEEAYRQALTGKSQDLLKQEEVRAARAALIQAKANYQLAVQQLNNASIRAPFSGVVAHRFVDEGTMAMPGTPVLRLVTAGQLYFEATVPETVISQVHPGVRVETTIDALPQRKFAGRVDKLYPVAGDARNFQVRVVVSGTSKDLKPGMFARGRMIIKTYQNVPLTPKIAVLESAGNTRLFVVKAGKATLRPVQIKARDSDLIYVLGVQPGEKVVIRGQDLLSDGVPVRVLGKGEG